jgi:hypothetical protein
MQVRGRNRMPNWQAEKAERNRKSLARLAKSLPGVLAPRGRGSGAHSLNFLKTDS